MSEVAKGKAWSQRNKSVRKRRDRQTKAGADRSVGDKLKLYEVSRYTNIGSM